jgi:cytochrome P450
MSVTNTSSEATTVRRLSELPGPRRLPLLGNLHELDSARLHLVLEEWARRYGNYFAIFLGRKPALVVSDSDAVLALLRDRPGRIRRLSALRDVAEELGAGGVFTAEGDAWGRQRRLVMAAFASGHMRLCYPSILKIADRLWRRLVHLTGQGQPLDVLRELMRFTVDVTTVVAFGYDLNTVEQGSQGLQHHLEVMFSAINRRILTGVT